MNLEINKVGFIYNFDMSKDINNFKIMPDDIQRSAEANTVKVIYESFVIPADEDYLMSRLLAQRGLKRGFYWAAAQAVEKYLKAFLLMNGESVIKFKLHPIKQLFDAACKIDSNILDIDISPHYTISVDNDFSLLFEKFTIQNFIVELEKHGKADNRYNAFGVEFNTGHLCALDSLSYQLRGKIGVIDIEESFKKISPDLMSIFENNNPWFSKDGSLPFIFLPSEDFPIQSSGSVTQLEFLIKNKNDNPAYSLALQWLETKMKIPK